MSGEIELLDYGNRDAWLAGRRNGLGASDVAALFEDADGCSLGYSTATKLWLEKTGQLPPEDLAAEHVDLGNRMEAVIAEIFSERSGRTVKQYGQWCVAQHPTIPFLRATPDRWITKAPDRAGRGLAQIKKANRFVAHNWREGVPLPIQIQTQCEMAVTTYDYDSVPVIFDLMRFEFFDVERDDDFIAELEERARWFWDLVQRREPPPIDNSDKTLEAIKRLHPLDTGATVRLPEEAVEWADQIAQAKSVIGAGEKLKNGAESKLRAAIGAATFGELPDGRKFSLKTTTRVSEAKDRTESTFRTLRQTGGSGKD